MRPRASSSTISRRYGSLPHCLRMIPQARPCGQRLPVAFRIYHPKASSTEVPSMSPMITRTTQTVVSFPFLLSPPPFGGDGWGWAPHVAHVAKDLPRAKSAPCHLRGLITVPIGAASFARAISPHLARQNEPLTISYDFKQGGRSDNVRPQRSQDYHPIYSTFRNPRRWATRLTTVPTARTTRFTTFSRARTKRRPCSTSGAMSSTGPLRRSALLLTGTRSVLVSAFSFDVSLIDAKLILVIA